MYANAKTTTCNQTVFLPVSVVPLDMDELSDSVVSGRFSVVSWLVRGEAAGGPDGLGARARIGEREAGQIRQRILPSTELC